MANWEELKKRTKLYAIRGCDHALPNGACGDRPVCGGLVASAGIRSLVGCGACCDCGVGVFFSQAGQVQRRCKVSSIPGLEHLAKDGWEIVRYDFVSPGECHEGHDGTVWKWDGLGPSAAKHIIVRKIVKPKQYRAFANAAEYEPHRDRWWMFKDDTRNHRRPPQDHDDCLYGSWEWEEMFGCATFDDGSPFGVEVTS